MILFWQEVVREREADAGKVTLTRRNKNKDGGGHQRQVSFAMPGDEEEEEEAVLRRQRKPVQDNWYKDCTKRMQFCCTVLKYHFLTGLIASPCPLPRRSS